MNFVLKVRFLVGSRTFKKIPESVSGTNEWINCTNEIDVQFAIALLGGFVSSFGELVNRRRREGRATHRATQSRSRTLQDCKPSPRPLLPQRSPSVVHPLTTTSLPPKINRRSFNLQHKNDVPRIQDSVKENQETVSSQ